MMSVNPVVIICVIVVTLHIALGEYIPPGPKYKCPKDKLLYHPCVCTKGDDSGLYIECYHTNIASLSLGLNNLATLKTPIEQLTLDNCHIAHLYGSLFYKLKVRVLTIKNTPIESIDEHTFHGINTTLNELYLLNTSLLEFPKAAFHLLGNLTILKIDQSNISSLPNDAFEGPITGRLLQLHVSKSNLSEIAIESITPLKRLKVLDFHANAIGLLKKNQFRGLRDTEVLDLSFNRITKIDSSHLADLTKLSWCNVSHNALTELTRGAFARNSVLRVLNMSHNKIKRLDTNSFRGMRFLRRLYMSDNLINDVGRGTFGSVTRIGTIDLARNAISKIDFQMFFQLNYIEIIDMSENNVTEIQKLAFKDLYLTNINLSRNAISKIENGAFENCANITLLDLSYNQISSIPKKAFDENTYANEIQLSYNQLTDLSQIPLHNMTGLRILNVSHNQIEIIPRHSFPKLYELHTIDLSHNNVSEIFNAVFQTLFSLRNLNLSYNSLETLKPGTFGTLPTLLELNLSYNRLKDVARSALTKLASARQIDISHNLLETVFILPISVSNVDFSYNLLDKIPEKAWPAMNAVLGLNFRGNRLENNLVKGSFEALLTLRTLDLSENGISEVPWEALSDLTSLQYLYLQNNSITYLKKGAFGRLPVVFELNMAHNPIANISERAFEGLLQLLTLNFTHNNLTQIGNGAFQGLVSLRSLDLSHNRIEKLENKTHGLLDDCLSLEKINLSHNKFGFITRKTFPSSPYIPYKLKQIDLSFNELSSISFDLTFGTSKVEYLNLSNNAISDVRNGVIGNLTNLKTLDLSNNIIAQLNGSHVFDLPANITNVYLANNHLGELPLKVLENATNLRVLDVSGNQLTTVDVDLLGIIKKNVDIKLDDNPLDCDCFLHPLKKYLSQQITLKNHQKRISCATPIYIQNQFLYEIPDDRLNCVKNVENLEKLAKDSNDIYGITSDLRFREVKFQSSKIFLRWLVNNNGIDIADFYVTIRQNTKLNGTRSGTNLIYEKNLPYNERTLDIKFSDEDKSLTQAMADKNSDLQLCILARDSKYNVKSWYRTQCRDIPKNLTSHSQKLSALNTHLLIVSIILLNFVYTLYIF